jgi:hypothetical protein
LQGGHVRIYGIEGSDSNGSRVKQYGIYLASERDSQNLHLTVLDIITVVNGNGPWNCDARNENPSAEA